MRLIASVVTKIARPGNVAIHQRVEHVLAALAQHVAPAGVGGCTPRPRKHRNDSTMMTRAIWTVAITTIVDTRFGTM